MISTILLAYYPAKQDITSHASPFYFKVCCGLLLVTFLANLPLFISNSLEPGRMIERLKITLIYVTNILAVLTSASLLLLQNISYAMLANLLPPIIAIAGIAFYKGTNTDHPHSHESELKQFCDFSTSVTTTAFHGMIGTIFGYFKNFPKDIDQVHVKFFVAFLFFTVIFGLVKLAMVPPC